MPVTKTQYRERLDALRERRGAARERRNAAQKALDVARQTKDAQAEAIAQSSYDEAFGEEEIARELEAAVLRQMSGLSTQRIGGTLANNLEAQQALADIASSTAPLRGNVHVGDFMSLDETINLTGRMLAAPVDLPDGDVGRQGAFLGIAPTPQAPLTLLDWFASAPFEGRSADLMRRSGVADASIQVEGAIKSEASLVYTAESIRAATVASWTKVDRQKIDDINALLDDLRNALRYGVLAAVEDLLLNGIPASTDGPAVPGILNAPGIVAPAVTATNLADAIGQAKAIMIASGVTPNFAAASPGTIEAEEERTGSDGHYVNTIGPDGTIRRLPLLASNALDADEVLLGDSRIGAALGVRQGISAVVGESDDDRVRNRVTVLVEGRWAPLITVPAAFAHFTIPEA